MNKGKETNTKKEVKEPKCGVGTVAIEALKAGKTNEEVLKVVKAKFPDAKTSLASINWYRNKLRTTGNKTVKTARELKKAMAAKKDPLG
mgnify:CR=1 FL=1